MTTPWYKNNYRRLLMDMHIPDWDPGFLAQYDPKRIADNYEKAKLTAVMFYCQSHVGLCNWPTKTGKMHAGLQGRDVTAEMVKELKQRNIAAVAYYSGIYNNWAFLEHPEWRMVPDVQAPLKYYETSRYGHCCPNNPGYRQFLTAQTEELVGGYDFDGVFFDMSFWPYVCVCEHCRAKFQQEDGHGLPTTVNWTDPVFCAFQSARERWIDDHTRDLCQTVKRLKPELSVYHNFVPCMFDWKPGCPVQFSRHQDYIGGDFYGDTLEQFFMSKLMFHLTENRPAEFMTSRCPNLRDHERLKDFEKLRAHAYAATLFSSALLFIDAVDPAGTANPDVYEQIGEIYSETAKYEPYLGGEAVEDIVVYFSNESKLTFLENGDKIGPELPWVMDLPHTSAARGVARILQQEHMPLGVITRKQLHALDRFPMIVLPDLQRMDDEEVAAFRAYLEGGGKLYASGKTSLYHTHGERKADFMLADVFGCHAAEDAPGAITYVAGVAQDIRAAVAPQHYITVMPKLIPSMSVRPNPKDIDVRLKEQVEGDVLATLTLPYGYPDAGSVLDQKWASVHSSPPWTDTQRPTIVQHNFGKGRAIYSSAPIEAVDAEANKRVFLALLERLRDQPLSYGAKTYPAVWMNVLRHPERGTYTIGFLNYQEQLPPVPIRNLEFWLRPQSGGRFVDLSIVPSGDALVFDVDASGTLHAKLPRLELFAMVEATVSEN